MIAPRTLHQSLQQGALLSAVVLVASFWQDLALSERPSWVFALLLIGGGALVWWIFCSWRQHRRLWLSA